MEGRKRKGEEGKGREKRLVEPLVIFFKAPSELSMVSSAKASGAIFIMASALSNIPLISPWLYFTGFPICMEISSAILSLGKKRKFR